MSTYQIPITYVVSATAVAPATGLEPLKLSTLLILTNEEPAVELSESYMIARTATAVANQWGTETATAKMAEAVFAQNPNLLVNDGYVIVAPFASASETYSAAIDRMAQQIYFEGIITTKTLQDAEAIAASAAVQAMGNRILFLPASDATVLSSEGLFDVLSSNTQTKCLLYLTGADTATKALNSKLFAASYASRGFAVNYNDSNTTITMNLKDLAGIKADTQISETILGQCANLGVDCFPSIEGLAKVISNRNTMFFDQVTNQIWLVNSIQRSVFNALATTQTKIPQTEAGMQILTNACVAVLDQAVANGMLAAGKWNSADTFGNFEDFHRNIEERGYYVYHQPVALQSQEERAARKAPLIQIAGKEAGAIHSANIIIAIEP